MFCFPYLCHEETATVKDKHDMITELNVMKGLKPHPHVLKLIGCCSLSGKLYIPYPRMYKQSHTPTVVQGGGGRWTPPPWVFVMLQNFEQIWPLVENL